jgi:putative ABC transport system ATP-binding protein
MSAPLRASELTRRFGDREVVRGVSLELAEGEAVALLGPSGCGKTTLLQMLGVLDRPDAGTVTIAGAEAWKRSAAGRAALRRASIGFVFQTHNLIDHMSAIDNVALPAWRAEGSRRRARERATELIDRFGLGSRSPARSRELSPGEAQRVAIARAIINRPAVILADEPTGSLDSSAATAVLNALDETRAGGAALLIVTHDSHVADRADRVLTMRDGALV